MFPTIYIIGACFGIGWVIRLILEYSFKGFLIKFKFPLIGLGIGLAGALLAILSVEGAFLTFLMFTCTGLILDEIKKANKEHPSDTNADSDADTDEKTE